MKPRILIVDDETDSPLIRRGAAILGHWLYTTITPRIIFSDNFRIPGDMD